MKKPLDVICVVIAALLIGWVIYSFFVPADSEHSHVVGLPSSSDFQDYNHQLKTDYYTIDIAIKSSGNKAADAIVRQNVNTALKIFESDNNPEKLATMNKDELLPNGELWQASWSGNITSKAGEFTNYRVDSYQFTGGAHGSPLFDMYVFDRQGRQISLTDVFLFDSNYEQRLSELARQYLLAGKVIDASMADSIKTNPEIISQEYVYLGTEPNENNFDNFALEHAGVRI